MYVSRDLKTPDWIQEPTEKEKEPWINQHSRRTRGGTNQGRKLVEKMKGGSNQRTEALNNGVEKVERQGSGSVLPRTRCASFFHFPFPVNWHEREELWPHGTCKRTISASVCLLSVSQNLLHPFFPCVQLLSHSHARAHAASASGLSGLQQHQITPR